MTWGQADGCRFISIPVTGDCSVTVRIDSMVRTGEWSKAGVMIRSSLAAGAAQASTIATPENGTFFLRRTLSGHDSEQTGQVKCLAANSWLRISRLGNDFSSFRSDDGVSWIPIGTATIVMPPHVIAGLAINAVEGKLCSALFSNVLVESASPGR
jgi:hypothetical protein